MLYHINFWLKKLKFNHHVRQDLKKARKINPSSLVFPASPATPDVSIIIPIYGQVTFTLQCLKSLLDSQIHCSYEVIVAEDASGDREIYRLREVPGITFIENPQNLGFLRSCNSAARKARGRYLYFLNNDTRLMPGAIDALVDMADARPDAGYVGSKLIYPDGRLQEAGGIIWSDASGWNYGRLDYPEKPEYSYVREADYISGASILVPRKVWNELGGFDDIYAPAYYEDTDLAFRVRQAGYKVLYQPLSVVVHYEGISHGTDLNSGGKAWQVVNSHKFVERWREVLEKDHYPNAQNVMRARDHARNRKVLLILDHYLPEPDRDAGSRTMIAFIQAAMANGWVVKFWPHNLGYGTAYGTALQQMGVEVLHVDASKVSRLRDHRPSQKNENWRGEAAFHQWISQHGSEIDYVLVSRPDVAESLLGLAKKATKARIAYYGHDLHFARMRMEAEKTGKTELLSASDTMEKLERSIWGQVDSVLYPSQQEADTVRALVPGCDARFIVPYAFDQFVHRKAQPATPSLLFVAGFGHPPNVDAALWLVKEVLPLIQKQVPDVKLVLAGSRPQDSVKALAGPHVEVTGTLSDEELARRYEEASIAVVPLRFGAGVKLKVVEAMQMGLPLVTTSTGAQGLPGIEDILPIHDSPEDFAAAVVALLADTQAALHQSQRQSAFVKANFSPGAMQQAIRQVFEVAEARAQA